MRRVAEREPRGVAASGIGPRMGPGPGRYGFTLVELLVTMAIIALLIGLLLPTLLAMRQSGKQTLEMSAARQLMVAYNGYANAHDGAVMPGYRQELQAFDGSGNVFSTEEAWSYPWRLAPYLDYNFRSMYLNENEELLERLENEDPALYRYAVSLFPSLGLNTQWVGGDDQESGFNEYVLRLVGRFYITRMTEARRPEMLMVFASARGKDTPTGPMAGRTFEGYYKIRSPYFGTSYRWSEDFNPSDPPGDYGYLSPRYGGSVVAAFLDSHVGLLTKRQLKDMRYWANEAIDHDWILQPP